MTSFIGYEGPDFEWSKTYADTIRDKQGVKTNVTVIDTAEQCGVRSYIFAPCIVYDEGEGFGNRTSIQDVAIVKTAKKVERVYKVDFDDPFPSRSCTRYLPSILTDVSIRPGLSVILSIQPPSTCRSYARSC